jgi:hypothetical protein
MKCEDAKRAHPAVGNNGGLRGRWLKAPPMIMRDCDELGREDKSRGDKRNALEDASRRGSVTFSQPQHQPNLILAIGLLDHALLFQLLQIAGRQA